MDLKTRLCPVADRAFSALLEDLAQRGMLDETLVIWTGEFGRTPKVGQSVPGGAGAGQDGRDHWAGVFTSVLAGGGICDRFAAFPASEPTRPADLAATIDHCLGVDPQSQLRDRFDRPLTLCEGKVIQPILV
jgi:arylsulfatase A-like enzyme